MPPLATLAAHQPAILRGASPAFEAFAWKDWTQDGDAMVSPSGKKRLSIPVYNRLRSRAEAKTGNVRTPAPRPPSMDAARAEFRTADAALQAAKSDAEHGAALDRYRRAEALMSAAQLAHRQKVHADAVAAGTIPAVRPPRQPGPPNVHLQQLAAVKDAARAVARGGQAVKRAGVDLERRGGKAVSELLYGLTKIADYVQEGVNKNFPRVAKVIDWLATAAIPGTRFLPGGVPVVPGDAIRGYHRLLSIASVAARGNGLVTAALRVGANSYGFFTDEYRANKRRWGKWPARVIETAAFLAHKYVTPIVAGAAVGALVGGLTTGGIGAVPGALAGAKAGTAFGLASMAVPEFVSLPATGGLSFAVKKVWRAGLEAGAGAILGPGRATKDATKAQTAAMARNPQAWARRQRHAAAKAAADARRKNPFSLNPFSEQPPEPLTVVKLIRAVRERVGEPVPVGVVLAALATLADGGPAVEKFAWKTGPKGGKYWLPDGRQDVPANRMYGRAGQKAAAAAGGRSGTAKPDDRREGLQVEVAAPKAMGSHDPAKPIGSGNPDGPTWKDVAAEVVVQAAAKAVGLAVGVPTIGLASVWGVSAPLGLHLLAHVDRDVRRVVMGPLEWAVRRTVEAHDATEQRVRSAIGGVPRKHAEQPSGGLVGAIRARLEFLAAQAGKPLPPMSDAAIRAALVRAMVAVRRQSKPGGAFEAFAWSAQKTRRGTVKAVGTGEHAGRVAYGKKAQQLLAAKPKGRPAAVESKPSPAQAAPVPTPKAVRPPADPTLTPLARLSNLAGSTAAGRAVTAAAAKFEGAFKPRSPAEKDVKHHRLWTAAYRANKKRYGTLPAMAIEAVAWTLHHARNTVTPYVASMGAGMATAAGASLAGAAVAGPLGGALALPVGAALGTHAAARLLGWFQDSRAPGPTIAERRKGIEAGLRPMVYARMPATHQPPAAPKPAPKPAAPFLAGAPKAPPVEPYTGATSGDVLFNWLVGRRGKQPPVPPRRGSGVPIPVPGMFSEQAAPPPVDELVRAVKLQVRLAGGIASTVPDAEIAAALSHVAGQMERSLAA